MHCGWPFPPGARRDRDELEEGSRDGPLARKMDLFSIVYVAAPEEAEAMAERARTRLSRTWAQPWAARSA